MSRHNFTMEQVVHFLALADELNFTRAARRCAIAQPPFSRSIQRLEEAVQVPLVERLPRGVKLTESGRVFADKAGAALLALRDAAELARAAQRTTQRLRIGMMEYAFAILGTQFVDDFARSNPALLIEPVDMPPEHLAFTLIQGVLDLQFAALSERYRFPARPGLCELVVLTEPLAILVSQDHPLSRRRNVTLAQIADQRLVLFERVRAPDLFQAVRAAFMDQGLRPLVEVEVGLLQTMVSAVRSTGGVGLVPVSVKRLMPSGLRVVPIVTAEAPRVRLSLVWSQRRETPQLNEFVNWVRACAVRVRKQR